MDIEYRFSATQNDGRITHRKDWISGEEVAYLYDTLGRLTSAATTGPEWGQAFTYDGFGNLTQQTVTKGSAPAMSMTVDAATNRLVGTGITYDAAGNLTGAPGKWWGYDAMGRVSNALGETYVYNHRNERVLINKTDGTKELNVYGVDGLLYQVWRWDGTSWSNVASKERIYFAGRLVMLGGNKVVTDRVGSVVRHGGVNLAYYPYGQERTTSANDQPKFGTYTRDSHSGLDYAMNRYYFSNWGRFTTPDPYRASGGPANPGSWNRYAYVEGDPVNRVDPTGLVWSYPCFVEVYTFCYAWGWDNIRPFPPALIMLAEEVGSAPTSKSGIDYALEGAGIIARGGFRNKPKCREFFEKLVATAGLKISADELMGQVMATAAAIHGGGFIYDGPSSGTVLDAEKFPGTATSTVNTVGQWFDFLPSREALSQHNGYAIWIRQGEWETSWYYPNGAYRTSNGLSSYGLGTLLHEILHKQSVGGGFMGHKFLESLLESIGALKTGLNKSTVSLSLAGICF